MGVDRVESQKERGATARRVSRDASADEAKVGEADGVR